MGKPKERPFFSTALFTVIGRTGGLALPFIIAILYGAGRQTDAFFFAYGLIFYFASIFTHVFESTLLPYLAEKNNRAENIEGFANGILFLSSPFLIAVSVGVGMVLGPALRSGSGWDLESSRLVSRFFFEMLPLLLFGAVISSHNGLFYIRKSFWFPAVSPLIRFLVVIGFILGLRKVCGLDALTGGLSAGEILRWGITFFLLWKMPHGNFRVEWQKILPSVLDFFKQAGFQILALAAVYLIGITDQWFASQLGPGGLSLLNYADRLLQIPYILFVSGVLQIFLTDWSESFYGNVPDSFRAKLQSDFRVAFISSVILGLSLWLLRHPLIHLFYGRSAMSAEQLETIEGLFGWLALGLIPGIMRLLYGRVLFVLRKAKFYCLQSWVELILNGLLNWVFMRWFGIVGIVMATVCIYTVTTLWLHVYLKKMKIGTV